MASATSAAADDAAEKLICVLGDEDTVTGFLLAGVGQRDSKGANFLVVDAKTTRDAIEAAFASYLARGDVGLIIINAPVADLIRPAILAHTDKVPMVLEIPAAGGASKASSHDPIMRRVMQMLGQDV